MATGLPASAALSKSRTVSTGCGGGKPTGGCCGTTDVGTGCAGGAVTAPAAGVRPSCGFAGRADLVLAAGGVVAGGGTAGGAGLAGDGESPAGDAGLLVGWLPATWEAGGTAGTAADCGLVFRKSRR